MKKRLAATLIVLLVSMTLLSGCSLVKNVFKAAAAKEESITEQEVDEEATPKPEFDEQELPEGELPEEELSEEELAEEPPEEELPKDEDLPDFPNTIHVKTAKEFLAAIAPDTLIVLEEGKYNIMEAMEETGFSEYEAYLQPRYDYGSEMVICDVENLMILGPTDSVAEIVVDDPTAPTLSFLECNNITISNVTVGHDVEKGTCSGSVISLDHCINVTLNQDDLYGCGTYGVEAYCCSGIKADDCTIRECTYGILSTYYCSDTSFNNCEFKECEDLDLIYTYYSSLSFNNCDFIDNSTDYDFVSRNSNSVAVFKGCSFGDIETDRINELSEFAGACYFDDKCRFDGKFLSSYVTVSNAKEFLEAVKPGATICVEPGLYNLTDCANDIISNRGASWLDRHKYISFEEEFDGVEVVLTGVDDLTIYGLGDTPDEVEFVVDPRYAEVFRLVDCNDISFLNLTAGHTDTGTCVGDVVGIEGGEGFFFDNVDLYGCGVNGIGAYDFSDIMVYNSVIRDCSDSPLNLYNGTGSVMLFDTSMYGSGSPGGYSDGDYEVYFQNCEFGVYESMGLNPMNEEAEEKISMFACTLSDTSAYSDYAYEW